MPISSAINAGPSTSSSHCGSALAFAGFVSSFASLACRVRSWASSTTIAAVASRSASSALVSAGASVKPARIC